MRCRIWLCEWENPDAGFEQAWLEHRAADHPTAERVAREHEKRLGREPQAVETPASTGSPGARVRVNVAAPVREPSPRPVAAEPRSRPTPHCVYCGAGVRRGDVCDGHRDLRGLDHFDERAVAA